MLTERKLFFVASPSILLNVNKSRLSSPKCKRPRCCHRPESTATTSSSSNKQQQQQPAVFTINPAPSVRATAFLLSSTHAMTALHALKSPTHNENNKNKNNNFTFNFGDNISATLERRCEHADIALLSISSSTSLLNSPLVSFSHFSSHVNYFLIVPNREKIPVYPNDVIMKLCSFSGALIPHVRLSHHIQHQQDFFGWSGAPVIRDDTYSVVGMLVQGDENYAEIIASPLLLHMMTSMSSSSHDKNNLELRRLPYNFPKLQPLIHPFAVNAYLDYDEHEENIRLSSPRITKSFQNLKQNDLLCSINGQRVRHNGQIEWAGLSAPLDTAVLLSTSNDDVILKVMRDGEELELLEVKMKSVDAGTRIKGSGEQRMIYCGGLIFACLTTTLLRSSPLREMGLHSLFDKRQTPEWILNFFKGEYGVLMSEQDNNNNNGDNNDIDVDDIIVIIGYDEEEEEEEEGENKKGWRKESIQGLMMERLLKLDGKTIGNICQLLSLSQRASDSKCGVMMEFSNGFQLLLSRNDIDKIVQLH